MTPDVTLSVARGPQAVRARAAERTKGTIRAGIRQGIDASFIAPLISRTLYYRRAGAHMTAVIRPVAPHNTDLSAPFLPPPASRRAETARCSPGARAGAGHSRTRAARRTPADRSCTHRREARSPTT